MWNIFDKLDDKKAGRDVDWAKKDVKKHKFQKLDTKFNSADSGVKVIEKENYRFVVPQL